MSRSVGFGSYEFGYADEPQWGLFNPAQSLFSQDPTLYGSLFATNQKASEARYPERAKKRAQQHPGLPEPVGPRGAWQRNTTFKKVGEADRLSGLGEEDKKLSGAFISIILVGLLLGILNN